MPLYKDLYIFTNLLRYASIGINAASTVSIELMIHNKPVINLGFDPLEALFQPGPDSPSTLTEHYLPLIQSKSVGLQNLLRILQGY